MQVEPLHFTCLAASDGTKMEKIDPCTSTNNIGAPLYDSTATNNNGVPDIKTIHQTYVSIHKLSISYCMYQEILCPFCLPAFLLTINLDDFTKHEIIFNLMET